MKLKLKYSAQSEIPEGFEALYTEVNGEWMLTGVEGMKTDNDVSNVQEALRKEREDHKATKTALAKFNGLDPEETLTKLDRFDELEASAGGNIDENKLNEMVETRIKSRLAPIERERDQLKSSVTEKDEAISRYQRKETTRSIHDAVRSAATASQMVSSAIEDALFQAERVFEIDEYSGKPVTKDGVGVTPGVSPDVWLTDMKTTRQHWWPASKGAGSTGGKGGTGGDNPFTRANWNMTEQGRLVREDREKAEQMAKAAGTKIGGGKPEK